eukprot:9489237-Pyramimonas_sp.AAC.1
MTQRSISPAVCHDVGSATDGARPREPRLHLLVSGDTPRSRDSAQFAVALGVNSHRLQWEVARGKPIDKKSAAAQPLKNPSIKKKRINRSADHPPIIFFLFSSSAAVQSLSRLSASRSFLSSAISSSHPPYFHSSSSSSSSESQGLIGLGARGGGTTQTTSTRGRVPPPEG